VGKVTIKGLDQLERKLKQLPDVLERALKRAVKGETEEIADDLRRDAPVDEGDLRDSIQAETLNKGLTGRAAITAAHAGYVVHGTSDTPANDFVSPVEADARRRFPDRVRREVLDELRKL
jgi:HK97 gp10 family phage protein